MQTAQKLSISLDPAAMAFLDVYRQRHKAASRSQVVNVALHTLERLERERTLEAAYRLSSADDAQLNAEFDNTAMDGLSHEAW
jgi:metal-responsive CopG/Arc/MetJ family transcriptional regulator